jgi:hypothetical protein
MEAEGLVEARVMQMSESILNFLDGEVTKYLIPDIERMRKLKPQGPEGLAACTIPTAMLLFVIVDLLDTWCVLKASKA